MSPNIICHQNHHYSFITGAIDLRCFLKYATNVFIHRTSNFLQSHCGYDLTECTVMYYPTGRISFLLCLLCCNVDFSELSLHLNSTDVNRVLFYTTQKIRDLSLFSLLDPYLIFLVNKQRTRVRFPVGTSFVGEVFRGFSSPVRCGEALGPQGPRISSGRHYHRQSSFITGANDLRYWRALKPQIYIHCQ